MKSRFLFLVLILLGVSAVAQSVIHERLRVDASDAPRNILHSSVTIPVSAGPMTLVYPKWIPGNHRPTGPIQNLMGLHIMANGQELEWQRDLVDRYAFHLQRPAAARRRSTTY